jgi:L-lactate dehydrogenase (cytochrome)
VHPANLPGGTDDLARTAAPGVSAVAAHTSAAFAPALTWQDLEWLRGQSSLPLVVKGVLDPRDAALAVTAGADAVVVSNHGGRQLDGAPASIDLLPEVVAEVGGDVEIMLDTGIMSGADVVAAIAMGARFTLIGRAYLYGLMAGGEAGVDRAIAILTDQVERTMRLLGVTCLEELTPQHVTQLVRLAPRQRAGE